MWLAGLKASTNFCGVYEFKYPQVDWTCSSSNLSILRLLYQLPVLTLHIPTPAGTPTPFLIMLYQFPILNLSIPTPASTPTPFLIMLDQFTILTLRIPTPVHPQPIPHYALPVSYINPLHPPPPPPPHRYPRPPHYALQVYCIYPSHAHPISHHQAFQIRELIVYIPVWVRGLQKTWESESGLSLLAAKYKKMLRTGCCCGCCCGWVGRELAAAVHVVSLWNSRGYLWRFMHVSWGYL